MALWNNFPYSNVHELNLDWIIEKMKYLVDQWDSYGTDVSADAVAGSVPGATVDGDLKTGLTFHFTLVPGPEGQTGPQGISIVSASMNQDYELTLSFSDGTSWTSPSLRGDTGAGLQILDEYATLADLQTAHPTGSPGDAYLVGVSPTFNLYIWSSDSSAWVDGGSLTSPTPASSTPLMDGVAAVGTDTKYARGDHRHPSDTAKQDVLVSGTNIKTVNSESLLGSGDMSVQETLVSGTNIKTINNESLLGSGDISVQPELVSGTNIKTINSNSILGSGDLNIGGGLVGIDPDNLIRSNVNVKSGNPYTAEEDCIVVTQTARAGWIWCGLSITFGGTNAKTWFPLKAGQTIEAVSGSDTYVNVYGIKI